MNEPWEEACESLWSSLCAMETVAGVGRTTEVSMAAVVISELRAAKAEIARLNGVIDEFRDDADLLREVKLAKAALELMDGMEVNP